MGREWDKITVLLNWLGQLVWPGRKFADLAQSFEADMSEAVSRMCGSALRVSVIHTSMSEVLALRSVRTGDGFVIHIDLEKLRPQWHGSLRNRVPPVLALLNRSSCIADHAVVCFADRPRTQEVSIVFCAQAGSHHILIPDYDFLVSRGFEGHRQWAGTNMVPWEARVDDILWRGVTTGSRGGQPGRMEQLPRVQLCLLAKLIPRSDVKIVKVVQFSNPDSDQEFLSAAGVMADGRLPVEAWAGHKFAVDIDGNSNSFNTLLHRQILGCCVLKVMSRDNWRQWFYDDIRPWVHFIPVKSDMSDLVEIVAWCRDHDDECRQIAERGRAFATGLDFEDQCNSAVERINAAFAD